MKGKFLFYLLIFLINILIIHCEDTIDEETIELKIQKEINCKKDCVNGKCKRIGKKYKCICEKGWTGPRCDCKIPNDQCEPNTCLNGGTCTLINNIPQCSCSTGWGGQRCQSQLFSLAENVPTKNLSIYELVYSQPYSYNTTTDEINEIRSQCTTNSLVCLGGSSKDDQDHLILVSCGNCLEVLAENPLKLINGAYWYFRPNSSGSSRNIGFSDTDEINPNNCDFTSPDDTKKLCWQLDFGGGGRLGTVLFTTSDCYYKKIYKTIDV